MIAGRDTTSLQTPTGNTRLSHLLMRWSLVNIGPPGGFTCSSVTDSLEYARKVLMSDAWSGIRLGKRLVRNAPKLI